jgi:hypothetical protein
MKKIFMICMMIFSASLQAEELVPDFHGFKLGENQQYLQEKIPDSAKGWKNLKCHEVRSSVSRMHCATYLPFEVYPGVFAVKGEKENGAEVYFELIEDRLMEIHVTVHASLFEQYLEQLNKLYGLPIEEDHFEVRDSEGNKYQNKHYSWDVGDSKVIFTKFLARTDRSHLTYLAKDSPKLISMKSKRQKASDKSEESKQEN